MQSAECKVQNAECRMQSAECRVQSAEYNKKQLKIVDFQLLLFSLFGFFAFADVAQQKQEEIRGNADQRYYGIGQKVYSRKR